MIAEYTNVYTSCTHVGSVKIADTDQKKSKSRINNEQNEGGGKAMGAPQEQAHLHPPFLHASFHNGSGGAVVKGQALTDCSKVRLKSKGVRQSQIDKLYFPYNSSPHF